MKRFLFVILCFMTFPLAASHIVGGEFEIIHLSGYLYRINLIIYFDEVHGLQANKDQDLFINARIFRAADGVVMTDVRIPFVDIRDVNYTKSECAIGDLRTSRMLYTTNMTMPPEVYNDPQGYYIVWERCCRNYEIRNIFSEHPDLSPGNAAGQTFYLKFPPVIRDGVQFINSTPRLFPPLSDYACINQPYYADFAGIDDDGDSLSYTIVTPLSTHTEQAYPPILSEPYPTIKWRPPYGPNNVMNGFPDLKISADGLLTVTPKADTGLFVFAVRCEEYRNGKKIGEVRRDFQMLVQDCKEAVAPKIFGKAGDGPYVEGNLSVNFSNTVSDDERCIKVKVSDADAFRVTDGSRENIGIRVIPIGFKGDVSGILPEEMTATLSPDNPEKEFQICFDRCPVKEGVIQIGVISYDDACALPLADTVVLSVFIEPPANSDPYFTTPDVTATVQEGDFRIWEINGYDDDLDTLDVGVITDGFDFGEKGFFLDNVVHENGKYTAELRWEAKCDQYDFTDRTDFQIEVTINDRDECMANEGALMVLDVNVDLPDHASPVIGTNLSATELQGKVERRIFESLDFLVFGTDSDNFPLTLEMQAIDFVPGDYGVSFPGDTGNSPVTSDFIWELLCGKFTLKKKDEFEFLFIVKDSPDKCGISRADTLPVTVHVLPPINTSPELTVENLSADLPVVDNAIEMVIGQQLTLQLVAEDHDYDPLDPVKIELIAAGGNVEPSGYQFTPVQGNGGATTTFTWVPECSVFKNGVFENEYSFAFHAIDDRCLNVLADTVDVNIRIKDVDGGNTEFLPPNFITPNGDGCNDFFGMEELEATACGEMHIPKLPKDNCVGRFLSIRMYNRWGKEVFQSDHRNFRWYATSEAAGVYFYTILYTNAEYKGAVTVMY